MNYAMNQGMFELVEALTPMLDLVVGHREDLLRRGFNETAAEQMAVCFYANLMQCVFKGTG